MLTAFMLEQVSCLPIFHIHCMSLGYLHYTTLHRAERWTCCCGDEQAYCLLVLARALGLTIQPQHITYGPRRRSNFTRVTFTLQLKPSVKDTLGMNALVPLGPDDFSPRNMKVHVSRREADERTGLRLDWDVASNKLKCTNSFKQGFRLNKILKQVFYTTENTISITKATRLIHLRWLSFLKRHPMKTRMGKWK